MRFVPHRKHTYWPPWPDTEIALLLYIWMRFVPYSKHTYWPPWPDKEIALLLYI
jgi:hypothetical protein